MAIWEGHYEAEHLNHPDPGHPLGHSGWVDDFESENRESAIAKVIAAAEAEGYKTGDFWLTIYVRRLYLMTGPDGKTYSVVGFEGGENDWYSHLCWLADYDSKLWEEWVVEAGGHPDDLDAIAKLLGAPDRTYLGGSFPGKMEHPAWKYEFERVFEKGVQRRGV